MTDRSPRKSKKLSREALITAALELIDEAGVEKLTARKLAQALGASPMALYWHFRNMEDLLDGVGDHLASSIVASEEERESSPWDAKFRAALTGVIDVAERHPGAADLVTKRLLFTEKGRQVTEQALVALQQAGLENEAAIIVARHSLRTAVNIGAESLFTQHSNDPRPSHETVLFDHEAYPRLAQASSEIHRPTSPQIYRDTSVELLIGGVRDMAARLKN